MVLADTSVWIDYFNGVVNWQTDRLDWLLDSQPVALGDLILTEVLQGFDQEAEFQRARAVLTLLPFYEFGGYDLCLQAANNYRILRRLGVTVRKTIDVMIATGCIAWSLELLHNDRDFIPMEQMLGSKVVKST
jgi:hypothetical protein